MERPPNFKANLCARFAKGTCIFNESCGFAHGEEELCVPGSHGTQKAKLKSSSPVRSGLASSNATAETEHFFDRIGRPRYICAPMVDQSELPFRMLCRKYSCTLCYTPMIHSRLFVEDSKYRDQIFTTCLEDRPLVCQFSANDPDVLVKAAALLEGKCDAIDINLGCPQLIAKRGNYGAYLLEKPELVQAMVRVMAQHSKIPIICKVRLLPIADREARIKGSIEFAQMLVDAGCQLLTVHGRTRHNKGQNVGEADWEAIARIRQAVNIPVFANGGIEDLEDVDRCLEATGADGVMSAEGLLGNPALFSTEEQPCPLDMALEYLHLVEDFPVHFRMVRAHLLKMLYNELQMVPAMRQELSSTVGDIEQARAFLQRLKAKVPPEVQRSPSRWILRHRPDRWDPAMQEPADDEQRASQKNAAAVVEEEVQPSLFGTEDDY